MANPNLQTDLKQDWVNNEIVMPADVNEWAERINNLNEVIPIYAATGNFYTATYSNNVYNLQPCSFEDNTQNVTPSSYIDGMSVCFKIPETNSAQCKININNLGEKYIKLINNTNIPSNYFNLNEYTLLKYDAENDCFYVDNNNCSNRDLSNLTATGEKHFVNKTQLTNCILEIPQNIKYTLEDGVLTIKAGTIVTVPYGTTDQSSTYPVGATFINNNFKVVKTYFNNGKFFVQAEVQADISISSTSDTAGTKRLVYIVLSVNEISIIARNLSTTSEDTYTGYSFNYRTDLNLVQRKLNTGITSDVTSLPIMVVTASETSSFAIINQVFNGMGYIGNTVFVNPGVKVLMTTTVNDDGSKVNAEYTTDSVYLGSTTVSNSNITIAITPASFNTEKNCYLVVSSTYSISPVPPENTTRWLNSQNGLFYILKDEVWALDPQVHLGFGTISDGVITEFNQYGTVSVADDQTVLHKYGNETAYGDKTLANDLTVEGALNANGAINIQNDIVMKKTENAYGSLLYYNKAVDYTALTPNTQGGRILTMDKNNQYYGFYQVLTDANTNALRSQIGARRVVSGAGKSGFIALEIDASGNVYGTAPTYTANYADSSTRIVTTAYMANHWVTGRATTTSSASKARPAVVVTNYVNGTSWYRVWSDGWIEQGGRSQLTDYWTITFPKAFTNTNYIFLSASEGDDVNCVLGVTGRTTTKINGNNADQRTLYYNWRACGY